VWDIGAGSGAVTIEAARLSQQGHVFAIEKNPTDAEICRRNLAAARCLNVTLVEGLAPIDCQEWPTPDAVFIGGSGGNLSAIVALAASRLNPTGHIVANLATLENLHECLHQFKLQGFETEVTLVQISRSRDLLGLTRLEALNPVFVATAYRAEAERES
jgi:precorrin-6Y C5,15-methyltransferase (decarboxylating)